MTMTRLTLLVAVATVAELVGSAHVPNYFGAGDWTDATLWQSSRVPVAGDEAWLNTDSSKVTVTSPSAVNKLVVARKSQDTSLVVQSDLQVGSLLFMGQYVDGDGDPAEGLVKVEDGGHVTVNSGEMSVGVSAHGVYQQSSGTTVVQGHCKIGRYNKAEAVGSLQLDAGSMSCNELSINAFSTVALGAGGVLRLQGNKVSQVNSLLSDNKIAIAGQGPGIIRIREATDRTLVYAVNSALKKTFASFVGQGSNDDFFTSDNFNGRGIPSINDEVWMNTANTKAVVRASQVVMLRLFIIGRHATGVDFEIQSGGELYVGDEDAGGVLFVGQYADAEGHLTIQSNSRVTVHGEAAIGVSGPGEMLLNGGSLTVYGRLKLGRYNNAEAVGTTSMTAGTVACDDFDVNSHSTWYMDGGELRVTKNLKSRLDGFIADGRIVSHVGDPIVTYDSDTGLTTLTINVAPTQVPTHGPTQEPTTSPTRSPTTTPSAYPTRSPTATPAPWDVAGIMDFTLPEVGPVMPLISRPASLRNFTTPLPATGVHPRVFFGPDEIPSIRARLVNPNSPMAVETMKQFEVYTVSMRLGRSSYNSLPSDTKFLPSGKERISNPGLFDTALSFTELKSGVTTNIAAQTNTHRNALAGVMAIEAFYCVVFEGVNDDVPERASDLVAAINTWSIWAVNSPAFSPTNRDVGGGQHMAFAYDMLFNFMSIAQQANVRKAIAHMIWPESLFKAHLVPPHALQSNWVTLNSFVSSMVMAIEGDVGDPTGDAGWSNSRLSDYFTEIMKANYNFFTYGWYSNGEPYEGMGKNYQYNMMMVAYAKRGYNFFTHPHVQAYAFKFLLAQMQPYGHYVTTYDIIGGSGFDPKIGGNMHKAVDIIALKRAFDHPAVNFAYRNFIESPYSNGSESLVEQAIDADKVSVRSTYENSFLSVLIMGSDCEETTETFESQNAAARDSLTFAGVERGLVIANSDYSPQSLQFQFHVRQDMGGHTMADRNNILLSGLGRTWLRYPTGYLYETQWTNGILVNDVGIPVTRLDGFKARQPGRLAHLQVEELATFATGDATYAYNTEWYWSRRAPDTDYTRSGFSPVTETWNDFRRSDNKIPHAFGNISFYDYPHWWEGGLLERNVKKTANDMKQVYRLAGMVRGSHPYSIVADDLCKTSGANSTNYKWIAQIPEDLSLMPSSDYPPGLDAERDAVLMEPEGTRRLLIRILNADGLRPNGLFSFNEAITYHQWGRDRAAKRFIIERLAEYPRFQVLLYPFAVGDPVPIHTIKNGSVIADWGSAQRDALVFDATTQTVNGVDVEVTALTVTRAGAIIIDTHGEVEPNPIIN